MRKIDLHIHTKTTDLDANFEFDMDVLKEYVSEKGIDAIAITNHNLFDLEQYQMIASELSGIIVFPGIEISIGTNKGHMLVIARQSEVVEFSYKCNSIRDYISSHDGSITAEQLKAELGNTQNYLLIPHYDKEPNVDKKILQELKDDIYCGEVRSIKKFIYCLKEDNALPPVYFSDFRPSREKEFPIRQTFIDTDDISLDALKLCLRDKNKLSLTEDEGHKLFFALPDLKLSTGLNVIIGMRSTGKTHTLNRICEQFDNVKYIRQFELVETDPEKTEKTLSDRLSVKFSSTKKEYLKEFERVVDDVKDISLESDNRQIDKYLETLMKYALEIERKDMFSKCKLFSETEYEINDQSQLKKLVEAVDTLLSSTMYKEIIEQYVSRESLIGLYHKLVSILVEEHQRALGLNWVNDLVRNVKMGLESRTSATRVRDVNFYTVMMNKQKIKLFEKIATGIKREREVQKETVGEFTIDARTTPFGGAGKLKNRSRRVLKFSDAYKYYDQPYKYLSELKNIDGLEDSSYHEYFVDIDYRILNKYGYDASGGERTEFNLLQELQDAYEYDMLIVDEPESSFDNFFLRTGVNSILREIAKQMPVIIVTHNNTVGASIKPDYLVYTERIQTNDNQASFEIYSGYPSSKSLKSSSGKEIKNIDVTLNCLESGNAAYSERKSTYEMLRD